METKLNHRVVQLIKRLAFSALAAIGISAVTLSSNMAFAGGDAPSVGGEYAKAPADAAKSKAALTMLGTQSMQANRAEITFKTIDSKRIESAKAGNSSGGKKALQVGVSRAVAQEATDTRAGSPKLKWQPLSDGSQIAYVRITSATAKAMRSGLRMNGAPAGTTLRFVGSDDADPTRAVAAIDINDVTSLADAEGLYWSPVTDGEVQMIEIYVPAGKSKLADISFTVESISHFFASAADKFQGAKAAGACNFDVACATQTQGFVNAKNSVALLAFTVGGNTGLCSGTLLNDADQSTQIPYFYSANHCFDPDGTSPNFQAIGNTVSTYWFYENAQCGPPDLQRFQSTQVVGGAGVLYQNLQSDVLFLRLNRLPPPGSWYSGWDSNTINLSTPTTIIHHAQAEVKKVTIGQVLRFDTAGAPLLPFTGSFITSGYSRGVTEPGSSGSGLFTVNSIGEYQLRGGLYGGPSTCSGNINDPFGAGNYDYYSRFDLAFPVLRQYLFTAGGGAADYTDLWFNPAENGWGMSVAQHGQTQFVVLYIYDNNGQPLWVSMPGGQWSNNFTTYSGAVYIPRGAPFSNYTSSAFNANPSVGTVSITYGATNATITYNINGSTGTKVVERLGFGSTAGSPAFNTTDIWWGGAAQNGWGINFTQKNGTLVGLWYTYGLSGNPTWFLVSGGTWSGNTFSAPVYTATASRWLGTSFNAASLTAIPVGSISIGFSNSGSAVMSYNVNGVSQSKALERVPF
jgi:lysyl endopeptidase